LAVALADDHARVDGIPPLRHAKREQKRNEPRAKIMIGVNRRAALVLMGAGPAAAALAACVPSTGPSAIDPANATGNALTGFAEGEIFDAANHYAARPEEPYPVSAVPYQQIAPRFLRQRIPYQGTELPGTVVVDPDGRQLYYVQETGIAIRYGVGVGREGFGWSGFARIGRKAEWPRWNPPKEMQLRDPRAAQFRNGMPPGIDNPLGARALYLFEGAKDTLYRIHGTNEPMSIGTAVSSGCVRMFNQDVMDLYGRVRVEGNVVVLPHGAA
jgi:lipoprotein-anchoring transpeptidase ErfK/SrfK